MIVERPALERRVLASLDAARIPVLLGGCGVGRSALLLRIADLLDAEHGQYVDLAACATTPEQCLGAITGATAFARREGAVPPPAASSVDAFHALLDFFDDARSSDGGPVAFLVDEVLEFRTFESFPGLRHAQRELVERLAASGNRFVLASRFTARTHRLLRDAPARFEVIHVPPLGVEDVEAIARARDGGNAEWAAAIAPAVAALSGGRVGYAVALVDALTAAAPADPVAALAMLMAPGGRLALLARFSYELRLHRARGYGALKAILSVLADEEPLTLTAIAQRLRRTPGSTKDYLSWLEDVDVLNVQRKRYAIDDPLLRLYLRLYGRTTPPADEDVLREVREYARGRLPAPAPVPAEPPAATRTPDPGGESGIIEID